MQRIDYLRYTKVPYPPYLQSEGVCSDANFLTGLRRPVKKLASEQTPSD